MAHMYCPEHIWEDHSLKLAEKIVYGVIEGLSKKEGYCYATNEFIGMNLEMGGDAVSRHISSLAKKGKIKVEVVKTKKKSADPQQWGTRRKIFIYFNQPADGLGQMAVPRMAKRPSIIDIDNKIEGEGEGTPPISPEEGIVNGINLFNLTPINQIKLLYGGMGIQDDVDVEAIVLRSQKIHSKEPIIKTVYHWWREDILAGKLFAPSLYYPFDTDAVLNQMPKTWKEVEALIHPYIERLKREKPETYKELQDEGNRVTKQYDL